MGISVNTTEQKVTASVTNDSVTATVPTAGTVSATVSAGFGAVGPQGPAGEKGDQGDPGASGTSGVITVSAPLVNAGTSSEADLSVSLGACLGLVDDALALTGGSLPANATLTFPSVGEYDVSIDATGVTFADGTQQTTAWVGVPADSVSTSSLQNASVTTAKLSNGAVTSAKLANGLTINSLTATSLVADNGGQSSAALKVSVSAFGITVDSFAVSGAGTITAGVWNGTAIGVAYGGTGATTQAGARTALGLGTAATAESSSFAAASHTHAASAIVSGTIDDARISSNIARTSDVTAAVAAVVNAAPASLDTLKELADALGNDASFATTVTNSLAAKAPIASPTFTGTVSGVTKSMVGLGNVQNIDATSRANHTGTQTASTISDFTSAVVAAAPPTTDASLLTTGTLSASRLPDATTTTKGGVIVGFGLSVASGTVSVITYAVRSDVVSSTAYTGRAVSGSATSASVWTIRKTVYTSAGAVNATTTATSVKWDDRLTATYS